MAGPEVGVGGTDQTIIETEEGVGNTDHNGNVTEFGVGETDQTSVVTDVEMGGNDHLSILTEVGVGVTEVGVGDVILSYFGLYCYYEQALSICSQLIPYMFSSDEHNGSSVNLCTEVLPIDVFLPPFSYFLKFVYLIYSIKNCANMHRCTYEGFHSLQKIPEKKTSSNDM